MKTLADISVGESARILRVCAAFPKKRRLADMGLTAGTVIRVCRVSPFGDPLLLSVRGFYLSLRKADAGLVWVETERGLPA